ncbi:MAG: hypothetical protein US60_C0040G0008 [Microgenomates group bacterium GW2011_GWC1_37_8]|nr:MAG: hypothetical protein US60_C0040G0008 [Microgenomates group bacterium GW2011_GWC1_37_8]
MKIAVLSDIHDHLTNLEKVGKTLLLNPSAVCGINFEKETYDKATYAIYDTLTNSAEIIEIS